jgi:hypothetical protein
MTPPPFNSDDRRAPRSVPLVLTLLENSNDF